MRSHVYRFTCGHVGRTADRHAGFIRVAEVRDAPVIVSHFPCPECKRAGHGVAPELRDLLTERSVKVAS